MPSGMARHLQHVQTRALPKQIVTFAHGMVWVMCRFGRRSMDFCCCGVQQLFDPASMIAMVMGHQNMVKSDAGVLRQPLEHLMGAAWVDHQSVLIVVQQPDVVVGECG